MEIRRFFIDKKQLNGGKITIDGDEYDHIVRVLRHKVGFKFIACTGDGKDILCVIDRIERDYLIASVVSIEENLNETFKSITLYQAVCKPDKLDVIIQKAVELGVCSINLFYNKFSQTDVKVDRLKKIALEACKQCKRAKLVTINAPIDFDETVKKLSSYDSVVVGYENEHLTAFNDLDDKVFNEGNIAVVVGSEGGFDDSEIQMLREIKANVFTLGKRILRAETAAISILTLTMYRAGELQ